MALDRQKILGELGSVMKQLQSADCGCLGKLFGNSQQAAPMMGSPLPPQGGCRRACCHGHGCTQSRHGSPTRTYQPAQNMNYMPMDVTNPSQQPMSENMYGFGPQIVNMMRGDHSRSQNMAGQTQGQIQEPMQGQLPSPMVIDAPQSPHGRVGLTPFTPPSMIQKSQFQPNMMNQGNVVGQFQNQLTPLPQSNNNGNIANTTPWSHQNVNASPATQQMTNSQMNPWPQQTMTTNPVAHQTTTPPGNPYGQHAEGIAKFNKMFPGVKQGMGGDLGFDPMAIAIQMNPDNHLKSAMNTMNKIMSGNKGMDQPHSQPGVAGNAMYQNPTAVSGMVQQNAVPNQNFNQMPNKQVIGQNIMPNQGSQNQQISNAYGQPIPQQNQQIYAAANANTYGQPIHQQNQQLYAAAVNGNAANTQVPNDITQQVAGQQYGQQQVMNLSSAAPNLPVTQQEVIAENQFNPPIEDNGYPSQAPAQQLKEPILPVDTSKNMMYMPTKSHNDNNYGYNTLGQPVEMLPAKLYHPPEPSLPQTLSPQPDPVKPPRGVNVKATVSKTSLMGNKPVGKTPSRAQLQHIYNQYKGSQSFTQQNVRHPGEGTCSTGRLNVPQATKAPPVPVERVGGDTVVNTPPADQNRINKVEQIMEQIGDVTAAKPGGDSLPVMEAPIPPRKCRNGLQDMVYTSYPTSAAWSFHGHGRNELSPTRRLLHRRY